MSYELVQLAVQHHDLEPVPTLLDKRMAHQHSRLQQASCRA
jgi:hypothetical protein